MKADGRPLPLYLTTVLDLADRKVIAGPPVRLGIE